MKIVSIECLTALALLLSCMLRDRTTKRSAFLRGAMALARGLRWLAAFCLAVAVVVDELHLWTRIMCELRLELARDSFQAEVAEMEK